ncbi:MAG: hypothetical protein AB1522_12105 [Chloroflexota bacterium]
MSVYVTASRRQAARRSCPLPYLPQNHYDFGGGWIDVGFLVFSG